MSRLPSIFISGKAGSVAGIDLILNFDVKLKEELFPDTFFSEKTEISVQFDCFLFLTILILLHHQFPFRSTAKS